ALRKRVLKREARIPVEDGRILAEEREVVLERLGHPSPRIAGVGDRLSEVEDQAAFGVVEHPAVALEVSAELGVVVEPPARGLRHQEIGSAARAHGLQVRDRRDAPLRVEAGVAAVLLTREMPGGAAVEIDELRVSLADDEDGLVGRKPLANRLA